MSAAEHKLRPISRFFRLLKVEKEEIYNVYLYSIIYGLINFSLPLGIQSIINLISSGQITTSWIVLTILVLLGIGIGGIFQIKQMSVSETLQQKIFARAAFEFAYRLPMIKPESIEKYHSPELVNRFFDSLTVQKGLSKILMDFSGAILMVILGLIIVCLYHPFFIFFSLFVLGYLSIIFFITTRKGLTTSLRESKYKYEVVYWLEEIARGTDVFRYSSDSEMHISKTDELVNGYINARKSHFEVLKGKYTNMVFFKILVAAGFLAMGGWLVIEQKMNIGQFVASEIIIILLINSVEKVILNMEIIYDVLTGLDKLGQVTDLPLEEKKGLKIKEHGQTGGLQVSFHEVAYKYNNEKKEALTNISFTAVGGERMIILGKTGSGKQTLMGLASASLPPKKGTVAFNDIPVSNMDIPSLRTHIALVRGNDQIFKGTVLENISLGVENPDLEKISDICNQLELSNFIFQSPEGFDTHLLPGGKGIPFSIAFKIVVARALFMQPRLLLMGEGYERITDEDRKIISKTIFSRSSNFTVIGFTNDEEFASHCDRVVILENGKLSGVLSYTEAHDKGIFDNYK